jgi:hypothetical protein
MNNDIEPLSEAAASAALTVEDEQFENIFDAPFITVNKVEGQYIAEVMLSGTLGVDLDRIATALDVGRSEGVRFLSGKLGIFGNNVTILFTSPSEV